MQRSDIPLIAVLILPLLLFTGTTIAQDGVMDIGDGRQLFIDKTFLAAAKDVTLTPHSPRKTGEMTIKPDHPWEQGGVGPYSSVLKVGDEYLMWYHVMDMTQWDSGRTNGAVCLAKSRDGIHWEKPELGMADYHGNQKNNIVFGHGASGVTIGQDGGMVFLDPTAPVEERFRMVIRHEESGEGVHVFSSTDGIRWKLTHKSALNARPQAKGHHLDSQNVIFWDDRLHKYVGYMRKNMNDPTTQGRCIARGESDQLRFPMVQDLPVVFGPDDRDLHHGDTPVVDYYMSAAIKYPWADDAYFMFPTAYYHYIGGVLSEFPNEVPTNAGPLHTQFAASRDGIQWERYDRRPFVPLGIKGEFDWASTRVIWGIVPDVVGREIYMYYRGSDWLHGWDRDERNKRLLTGAGLGADQNIAVLSRIVLRRDGFVSVHGAYTGGEFATPLLKFRGDKLVINVDTSATGIIRIGLLDKKGASIDGFGVDDCDLIHTANEINRVVTWKKKHDVSALAGKPVKLHVMIRDADLYAFQFQN